MAVGNSVDKKSFVLYTDHKELWENLSNEQAGKLIKHIYRYIVGEKLDAPDEITKLLFFQIKATLDRDHKKWEAVREARSENGKKGGRPPKAKKADGFGSKQTKAKNINGFEEKQNTALEAVNGNANDTATVIGNDNVDNQLYDVDTLLKKYLANEDLVEAAKQKMGFSGRSGLEKRLTEFNMGLKTKAQNKKKWNDYLSHFMHWDSKFKQSDHSKTPTFNSPVI